MNVATLCFAGALLACTAATPILSLIVYRSSRQWWQIELLYGCAAIFIFCDALLQYLQKYVFKAIRIAGYAFVLLGFAFSVGDYQKLAPSYTIKVALGFAAPFLLPFIFIILGKFDNQSQNLFHQTASITTSIVAAEELTVIALDMYTIGKYDSKRRKSQIAVLIAHLFVQLISIASGCACLYECPKQEMAVSFIYSLQAMLCCITSVDNFVRRRRRVRMAI